MHCQFGTTRGHGSQIYFYIEVKSISKLAVYCAGRDKYTSIQEIWRYGLPRRGLCYVDLRSTCFRSPRFNAPCRHFSIYVLLFSI
jgi:hypothetical protein